MWLIDWETGSYREMLPATTYEIISCGSQRSVIKSQMVLEMGSGVPKRRSEGHYRRQQKKEPAESWEIRRAQAPRRENTMNSWCTLTLVQITPTSQPRPMMYPIRSNTRNHSASAISVQSTLRIGSVRGFFPGASLQKESPYVLKQQGQGNV